MGREFLDERTGKTFRPSMFLTLTLPSYGKVIEGTGVPARPDAYDYRRAALDALLFPRLLDRFWQNLRRCAGYKVQYLSAIEAQRRLAPHLHAALRGAIPGPPSKPSSQRPTTPPGGHPSSTWPTTKAHHRCGTGTPDGISTRTPGWRY